MKQTKIEPIISEKSNRLAGENWYSFKVPLGLKKKEAKDVIETNFKVKVVKTHSLARKGKERRVGRRTGMTKPYKKIMVRLKKGQKIDIFEVETKGH